MSAAAAAAATVAEDAARVRVLGAGAAGALALDLALPGFRASALAVLVPYVGVAARVPATAMSVLAAALVLARHVGLVLVRRAGTGEYVAEAVATAEAADKHLPLSRAFLLLDLC